jgi:hypothetical protein
VAPGSARGRAGSLRTLRGRAASPVHPLTAISTPVAITRHTVADEPDSGSGQQFGRVGHPLRLPVGLDLDSPRCYLSRGAPGRVLVEAGNGLRFFFWGHPAIVTGLTTPRIGTCTRACRVSGRKRGA